MICKNCGAALADDCIFCSSCGSKLEPEPTGEAATMMDSGFRGTGNLVEGDLVAHIPQEEVGIAPQFSVASAPEGAAAFLTDEDPRCPNCGEIPEAGALFCNHCGTKLCESVPQNAAQTPPAGRARKFPIKWVCIASGAVLLLIIIILIVGAATNWFGAKGPAAQIGSAFKNTFSAESYTVDFSFSYDEYRIADTRGIGTAYFVLQPAQRNFTAYIDVVIDDESAVFAIYDGYYIVSQESGTWAIDISDELDEYFNAYEEAQSMDSSLKNISWKELIDKVSYDGAYDEASEYVDFDNLSRCLTDYLMKLNDEKWLEENAGYSTEKDGGVTMYCFAPDIYTFLKESASYFEDVFVDSDAYDEMQDAIRDLRYPSRYTDTTLTFGVKNDELVSVSCGISGLYDGLTEGDAFQLEVEFSDIGETQIDLDELEELLAEAWIFNY